MRRRWAWAFTSLFLDAYRAQVVIFDDLGLLKQMRSPVPGTSKKVIIPRPSNQRGSRPPAMPTSGRNSIAPTTSPPKPQLPRGIAILKSNSSPAKKLLSQAPISTPVGTRLIRPIMDQLGPRRQQPPNPRPSVPGRGMNPPRRARAPTSPNTDRADSSNSMPDVSSNAPDISLPPRSTPPVSQNGRSRPEPSPEKTIVPRERRQPSATEDPYISITTVVSYVSTISSRRTRNISRSSIDVDSAALSSANSSIPGASQPPSSSTMDDIPGRAAIDDKKLRDYVNDHDSNIDHANTARKSFLSMKIQESQNASKRNEAKLANLQRIYDEYSKRMDKVGNEIARVKSNIAMYKALVGNTGTAIVNLDNGIRENETQRRLEDIELLRLNKEMNEEKNKIELLKEKSAMLKSRLKQLGANESENVSKLRTNEGKLGVYIQLAGNLDTELRQLREDIDEVESLKRKDQDVLSKLEIEYNQYESDRHWPLFVRYT